MKIVLATIKDLGDIKNMYTKIVGNMYTNGITIWNQDYPNEEFESDIKNKNLYLLKEDNNILGAFVTYEHTNPEKNIEWKNTKAKAYFLTRVGVNVDYLRQGIGKKLIEEACDIAHKRGAGYLRLLVSEFNHPAIKLYSKCKFNKLKGIHEEKISEDLVLNEYGFEMQLNKISDANS